LDLLIEEEVLKTILEGYFERFGGPLREFETDQLFAELRDFGESIRATIRKGQGVPLMEPATHVGMELYALVITFLNSACSRRGLPMILVTLTRHKLTLSPVFASVMKLPYLVEALGEFYRTGRSEREVLELADSFSRRPLSTRTEFVKAVEKKFEHLFMSEEQQS
jgi:hypothetical protein